MGNSHEVDGMNPGDGRREGGEEGIGRERKGRGKVEAIHCNM